MDIDFVFKIAAIGIIVAVLNTVLIRSGREEQAMLTTLAGVIVVLTRVVREIGTRFRLVKTVFGPVSYTHLDVYKRQGHG